MYQIETEAQFLKNVMAQANVAAQPQKIVEKKRDSVTWNRPGFGGKSRVQTSFGLLPIEALRRRDPVKTASGRYLEVQWVDKIELDSAFLCLHPQANPILIPRSSLGHMIPAADTLVSPAQKLTMRGVQAGASGTTALALLGRSGIAKKPHAGFTYHVFHCGEPATVCIDGLWIDVRP